MLFCDFYKKLKKAIGDTEFGKLPPVKGEPYQKIFMLMTLSCDDKSKGNCGAECNKLNPKIKDKFQALKNDLENLKVNLQELKKELKDTESLVNDEEIRESFKKLKKTSTILSSQDGYFTIEFNDILDTLTDRLDKNRTVIDSIFKVTEVIPEDSLLVTINFKDLKDFNDNGSRIYDSLIDNFISNLNKDIDNINKSIDNNKYYDIPRYSKYLGVSLKNDFPDYWQIAEYIKYLYFWRSYELKSQTFKDYCIKRKASISKFAQKITPYLVSHPFFIDVINNLSDELKWKIYEEFHEELQGEIDSLDFLGEKLAALLKKIIDEAADKDLRTLEKLWEKEEDNFLEMVLYPILDDLFGPNSATYFARYSFYLKIRNEKNKVIIENHPNTFLDNLFFFIAKKKKIFFDDFKLENIQPSRVYIGGVVDKGTTFDEIYGNKNKNENENKTELSCGLGPLMFDLSNFFTEEKNNKASFTDLKQILKFKKTLKNGELYDYDDSFVLIELNPLCENPLSEYSEKIMELVDLRHENPKKYEEQIRFWEEKRTAELYKENPLFEYSEKNKDKIGRNLHYENPEKYEEQKSFWEEKRTSELYKYIEEKLKTEEAPSHISTPFQSLRNYYLLGDCPVCLSVLDQWDFVKGS